MSAKIEIPKEQIAEFCRRNHICRLALFGSVLRPDFAPDSDIDLLVESLGGLLAMFGSLQGLKSVRSLMKDGMCGYDSFIRYQPALTNWFAFAP